MKNKRLALVLAAIVFLIAIIIALWAINQVHKYPALTLPKLSHLQNLALLLLLALPLALLAKAKVANPKLLAKKNLPPLPSSSMYTAKSSVALMYQMPLVRPSSKQ